jgi:hypothetical protein
MRLRWGCWLVLLPLWFAGCATTGKIDWNSRIGTYTFDQAVREYGPPDKSADLADGTRVTEWLLQRGQSYGTFQNYPGVWTQSYYETRTPDFFLRLTFDASGKLKEWKRVLK